MVVSNNLAILLFLCTRHPINIPNFALLYAGLFKTKKNQEQRFITLSGDFKF